MRRRLAVVWRRSWNRMGRTRAFGHRRIAVRRAAALVRVCRLLGMAAVPLAADVLVAGDDPRATERASQDPLEIGVLSHHGAVRPREDEVGR
jgi:hypothetical protein